MVNFKGLYEYFVNASTIYDVHSPYWYTLLTGLLDFQKNMSFPEIESKRNALLNNHKKIRIIDHGAGSKTARSPYRVISEIAKSALTNEKDGLLLSGLIHHLKPTICLELGTCFGIGSSYMSFGNLNSTIYTIEGNPDTYKIALETFTSLSLKSVIAINNTFKKAIDSLPISPKSLEFIYLDGHHAYEPTIQYFESLLPYCSDNAVIVLDDLYWSPGMTKAWKKLCTHSSVSTSLNLFSKGILFLSPELLSVQPLIFIPWKFKPWRFGFFQ